jgi:nucleoporin NUP82
MLAVYETIDFGLVSTLNDLSTVPSNSISLLDLLHNNHPTFLPDPLHDDTVYVYHAFGVHALDVAPVLQSLAAALRTDDEDESVLKAGLEKSVMTNVQPILNTFSVERRSSNPVVAIAIPNDVYLTYSMFILTSAMRVISVPLNLRAEPLHTESAVFRREDTNSAAEKSKWFSCIDGPSTHVSILGAEPFVPPSLTGRFSDLSTSPKLLLPQVPSGSKELTLTPDTLRFLGTSVAQITSQSREVIVACQVITKRMYLQQFELPRLTKKCQEMESLVEKIQGPGRAATEARLAKVQEEQKALLARLDHLLQSLMEKASPELSEHEAKWFEELKRMKEDVLGRGRYDENSLVCRTRLVGVS